MKCGHNKLCIQQVNLKLVQLPPTEVSFITTCNCVMLNMELKEKTLSEYHCEMTFKLILETFLTATFPCPLPYTLFYLWGNFPTFYRSNFLNCVAFISNLQTTVCQCMQHKYWILNNYSRSQMPNWAAGCVSCQIPHHMELTLTSKLSRVCPHSLSPPGWMGGLDWTWSWI